MKPRSIPPPSNPLGPEVEVLKTIIRGLVEYPEKLKVEVRTLQRSATLIIDAAPEDHGKIIGAHGKTLRCLQALAGVVGKRLGLTFRIHLVPTEPAKEKPAPFMAKPDWRPDLLLSLLQQACDAIFAKPCTVQSWSTSNLHHVEVTLSRNEPATSMADTVEWTAANGARMRFGLTGAVSHLFRAIGMAQGGRITIDFCKNK